MIALSSTERFEYILKDDRGENPTVWLLKPLTVQETVQVEDILGQTPGEGIRIGTYKMRVLRLGLVGWSNLCNEHGEEVPFQTAKDGLVSEAVLVRLPSRYRTELSEVIVERTRVSEDDEKN